MYDRGERNINLTSREDLGPHLGPTSYDINLEFKKCSIGGYAPFGSLEQRNTIFTLKRNEVPSPPAYSPKLPCRHIKVDDCLFIFWHTPHKCKINFKTSILT